MIQVQVTYAQGLVKTFIAGPEALFAAFADTARKLGRVRSMRFQPDISEDEARSMVATGNAILLGDRRTP